METVKVYVDSDDSAVLTCPHCGKSRIANVGKFKDRRGPLRVKCSCKTLWGANLEFRRAYRKPTNLRGKFVKLGSGGIGGVMTVKNISMGGVGFTATAAKSLRIGDQIMVEFRLDDAQQSHVKKKGTVRVVDQQYVGMQFSRQAGQYDAALGFYLRR